MRVDMRTAPDYRALAAVNPAVGLGRSVRRRNQPRHVLTSRLFCVHGIAYGRAVLEGASPAGDSYRSTNPHGSAHPLGRGSDLAERLW